MMEQQPKSMNCRQAKELDMVDYLAGLGLAPARIRRHDYWYRSPLREEQVPSFKINRRLNRWYDHGLGKGGNLIDFALLYHGCSLRQWLHGLAQAPLPPASPRPARPQREKPVPQLRVLAQRPLSAPVLARYLRQRCISLAVAQRYCREIDYRLYGRTYRAIGFPNDAGGFELRDPSVKRSSSPKSITTLREGAGEVVVFEGFMDFLSFRELGWQATPQDVVVLNSLALLDRARPLLTSYDKVHLYLDNDAAGARVTTQALLQDSRFTDKRPRFAGAKDLNAWLVQQGRHAALT